MTLDTNIALRLWNPTLVLTVTNGATLALRNGILEGGNNGISVCTNVFLGRESAATLALRGNSTNTFRRSDESLCPLCVVLGSNATVNAETGSVLQVQECYLSIGIRDGAAWGWKTAGTVVVGTGVVFEAMNTDGGPRFPKDTADRSIKELRLQATGDLTLTLSNTGSMDNDVDGTTDSVVYVDVLDVSGMVGGASAHLAAVAGSGIGTPRLYYRRIRNPNNVMLDAGFLPVAASGTVITFR